MESDADAASRGASDSNLFQEWSLESILGWLMLLPTNPQRASDRLVRFKMRAVAGEHKIGSASAGDHRADWIHLCAAGAQAHALIVRNFSVNPSGEYADVPWTEPDDKGYSTQACSVNSRWGMFSEMEYHVPAIGGETGLSHIEDRSQLWAFRGQQADIKKIARALLSPEV